MAPFPKCRSCGSDYTLVREEGGSMGWYEFACERCKVGHVFSKPRAQAAGRYAARLKASVEAEQLYRRWSARPSYSLPTKTSNGVD